MLKVVLIAVLSVASFAHAKPRQNPNVISLECNAELAGDDVVNLDINMKTNTVVKLEVNGRPVLDQCTANRFTMRGNIFEYGRGAALTFNCLSKGGKLVINNDYDEMPMEMEGLMKQLKGITATTGSFMCH